MWLCFRLSMPNVGSWNGKWTGESNFYAIVKSFQTKKSIVAAKTILEKKSYYYNFGDGWGASISVREVDGKEVRVIKRKTRGFCGYDWMVNSIVDCGRILNSLGEEHG